MAKGTEQFKEAIKKYLDSIAEIDDNFNAKYTAEGKTLDECVDFILGEVQRSGCNGFDDAEIYGMAVHYYEEADLKVAKSNVGHVVVNHHIELSESEKEEARKRAIESYEASERKKIEDREKRKREAEKKKAEEVREARKRAEEESSVGSLFDF